MVTLTVEDFGKHKEETVKRFTWRTSSGFELNAISYGAIVQCIKVRKELKRKNSTGFSS